KVFCHWDIESNNRMSLSTFRLYSIDTQLCNHIVFGSATSLDPKGSGELSIINEELLVKNGLLEQIVNMKRDNIKTILSIGGGKDQSNMFSKMAAEVKQRDKFYASLIKFLYKWEFNGIFIDWEYPMRDDRNNFANLLKELRVILHEHHFMIMVVVSARLDAVTLAAYDIPQIAKNADFMVLNTHDGHDPYSRQLNYNAPLYGNGSRSVERSVLHWVKHGKIPAKLLLGLPLFVHTYTLDELSNTMVGAASKGPGRQHEYSSRPGFMTVGEFCLQASKWEKKYDKLAEVPYAYGDDQWASYENGRSLSAKLHLAMKHGLGGAMAWSIDADDFEGRCGERFGLLRVIIALIGDPNTLTTQAPTTEGFGLCPQDGFFRHPWDCRLYHECRHAQRTDYECPVGDYFVEELAQCQPSKQVKCNQNFVTWRPGDDGYNYHNLPLNLKIVQ
ncbi:GH21369, partial [Drosophila grimshawi]